MSRAWIFVWNNPTSEIAFKKSTMNYLSYVLQEGKGTHTPHFQGYVQFKKEQDWNGSKKKLPEGCHREIARSNWQTACGYFADMKMPGIKTWSGDTNVAPIVEHGEPEDIDPVVRKQGKRTDLEMVKGAILEGATDWELMNNYSDAWSRNKKFINDYRQASQYQKLEEVTWPIVLPWVTIQKPVNEHDKKRHYWIWGPPNCGKTIVTQNIFEGKRVYFAQEGSYTFEGYQDEDVIVYDDVTPSIKEMEDVSNCWRSQRKRAGGNRYESAYWKLKQLRTMIVLSNKPRPASAPIIERFHEIEIRPAAR